MSIRTRSILVALVTVGLLGACDSMPTSQSTDSAVAAKGAGNSNNEIRLEARLVGSTAFSAAKGKARFKDRGGERELQIEIENVRPGTMVSFLVGGIAYGGTQTVDGFGAARINVNTDLGDAVPTSVAGQLVQVVTSGGDLIASGSF
jgi:hypothetical protein